MDFSTLPERIRNLSVQTPSGLSGHLSHNGHFGFQYQPNGESIALDMPSRSEPYNLGKVHPIFTMNLPEGYVREYISHQLEAYGKTNDMMLLALQGNRSVGRLSYDAKIDLPPLRSESLEDILSWPGDEATKWLMDRYWSNGIVSGAQPKVLIQSSESMGDYPDLIVKWAADEFPHLAFNEYACMSIAKAAGLEVPEFWLSKDQQLFVVKRFDVVEDVQLGMEDVSVLMGGRDKYRGSYEAAARSVIQHGVSEDSVRELYRQVCLSVLIGNGDAHLRNFSVLYREAGEQPWLSPVYDLVCTLQYPALDRKLALTMDGSHAFPSLRKLIAFGQRLNVDKPGDILHQLKDAIDSALKDLTHHNDECGVLKRIEAQANSVMKSLPSAWSGRRHEDFINKPRKTDRRNVPETLNWKRESHD